MSDVVRHWQLSIKLSCEGLTDGHCVTIDILMLPTLNFPDIDSCERLEIRGIVAPSVRMLHSSLESWDQVLVVLASGRPLEKRAREYGTTEVGNGNTR